MSNDLERYELGFLEPDPEALAEVMEFVNEPLVLSQGAALYLGIAPSGDEHETFEPIENIIHECGSNTSN
jgi:hypothetical protein